MKPVLLFAFLAGLLVAGSAALAQDITQLAAEVSTLRYEIAAQQANSDHIWVMTAAALVLFMQVGFLLLEAGSVRSKNSINVAQKNVVDLLVSISVFYLVGFGLMFGASAGGWIGGSLFAFGMSEDWNFTFFVFQAVFVGTCATIMSGAVAERMKFSAYLMMAVCIALFIYPVFGHWAWGNLLDGDNTAFLADMGFIDFAGSTVVHSVGAWIGLAGIIVLGPRLGKFNADGSSNFIQGYSAPLAAAGGVILLVGWFGFNGGSTTAGTPDFARIVANTLLAATFGGVAGLFTGMAIDKVFHPLRALNGMLAGLVAITAGCDAVEPYGAVAIGLMAGVLVVVSELFFERFLKLDDVIGAVSVHGVCGVFGTVILAFFAMDEKLAAASRMDQFMVQCLGVAVAFVWTFGTAFAVLKTADLLFGIRVSREDEELGLNISEHGATLGTGEIQRRLLEMTQGEVCDLTSRFDETAGDEAAEIAQIMNPFITRIQHLISNIANEAEAVNGKSRDLAGVADNVQSNVHQVDRVSGETTQVASTVREKLDQNAQLLRRMNTEGREIAGSAKNMAVQMDDMAQAVNQVAQAVSTIGRDAEEASTVSREATAFAQTAHGTVQSLKEATGQIDEIVAFILEISGRTNLLALNATIEASRAGEAGKGFAIVAQEVKDLAVQTARAVEDIRQRVGRVQEGSDEIYTGIGQLTEVVQTINSAVDSIRTVAGEQATIASGITENVENVASQTSTMTARIGDLSGFIGDVDRNSTDMSDMAATFEGNANQLQGQARTGQKSAEVLAQSSGRLSDVADSLQTSVKAFAV